MHKTSLEVYRCPATRSRLRIDGNASLDIETVSDGMVVGEEGHAYANRDGIPDFTHPPALPEDAQATRAAYDGNAEVYDEYVPLTFSTFGAREWDERARLVDLTKIEPGQTVLEVGCGTGRDSTVILNRLGDRGRLFVQDLSPGMLAKCRERLSSVGSPVRVEYACSNACHLPMEDNAVDRLFHFGGVNNFPDIKQAFSEFARVVRPGGRIVVGDESMPPWLRETEFAKTLMNSNPLYRAELPLNALPVSARNVELHWIIGGVFYAFAFDVEDGEPIADFDFPIPGARGGTHRTRYHGQLEGVSEETKALAHKAREALGVSMHDWLDDVVRQAARKALK
jgi:ubiquinone/menaquinone biosynthesis C-methylase UbiE